MLRTGTVTLGGKPITLRGEEIKKGMTAPDFKAVKQDMSEFDFYSETDGKIKVISIAHSVDTGVCSLQTGRFNEEAGKLKDDVEIITITVDLPFALKRYCGAEGIGNIQVVSDHKDLDFGEKYGFIIDEIRLLARGVVVVDKNNVVQYVEYVPEVATEPDYDQALEVIRKLI